MGLVANEHACPANQWKDTIAPLPITQPLYFVKLRITRTNTIPPLLHLLRKYTQNQFPARLL